MYFFFINAHRNVGCAEKSHMGPKNPSFRGMSAKGCEKKKEKTTLWKTFYPV